MLLVTADVHERPSGVPGLVADLGVVVEFRPLPRGDYVVGPETVVERKTVIGLHRSICEGRFWNQMGKLREAGAAPVLLIEGSSLFGGPLANDAIRGLCLSITDLGITILRSEDPADSAAWLVRLAERRRDGASRNRPSFAQRPRRDAGSPGEAAISAAPGVSAVSARAILEHFRSIENLCRADLHELQSIRGIGSKRGAAIHALLHDRWTAPRSN